jgi:glycosyltransferase involved in cell wall biosynthesis
MRRFFRAGLRGALCRYARARPSAGGAGDGQVSILLLSAWGTAGTVRAALNLADYFARTRSVEILSVFRRMDEPFFHFPPGVKVSALDDWRPGATPRGVRLLRNILRRHPSVLMHPADRASSEFNLWVDVMFAHRLRRRSGFLIGTESGLNLIAAKLSPPGMLTIGEEQTHLPMHPRPLRRSMRRHYRRLDTIVGPTESHLRSFEPLLSRRDGSGPVRSSIPHPVWAGGGRGADLSAQTVLAAGTIMREKGFDLLIKAYAQVAKRHPDWRLRICGAGDLTDKLRIWIMGRGLADVIEFPGPRDMEDEMSAASIFVLSSRSESFPLALLEAMSKGMAVVSFDCPTGPGDILDDHRNGILVPPKHIDGLAQAICELIENEDLRRACAAAAVETAREYTIEAVGPRWDALFDELARARRTAPLSPSALHPSGR